MKKTLAVLMLAAMMLSTGCGNNTMDGAKKDAQEAQQKVEQKADEAKAKAEEVKADANAKAEEVKQDAAAKVDEAKDKAAEMKSDAAEKMNEVKTDAAAMMNEVAGRTIELAGVKPGLTFDAAKAILGEPVSAPGDDEFIFDNGLELEIDKDKNIVEELKIKQPGIKSADGVEVGMMEYALNEYCGPADAIEHDDGAVEYKYYGGDKKSKLVYTARNGFITEIKCSLRD